MRVCSYVDRIVESGLNTVQKIVFTSNDVFNAIINTKLALCKERGIITSINISDEAVQYIESSDIVIIFGNIFDNDADEFCNVCGETRAIRGDMNGDGKKNSADAIYLLRHMVMPVMYPVNQNVDVNGDGKKNSADAIYLLRHIVMPNLYPLKKGS